MRLANALVVSSPCVSIMLYLIASPRFLSFSLFLSSPSLPHSIALRLIDAHRVALLNLR